MKTEKEIEKETIKHMLEENKGYYNNHKIEYSLKHAMRENDKMAKRLVEELKIKPSETVLDAGCGFGDLTLSISKYAKRSVGIDINKKFTNICKKKKILYNIKKAEFFCTGGESLPFKKEEFDVVISKTVLEHVENVEKTINEMSRVLKPKGRIYIECPNYLWIKEGHYHIYMLPLMPKAVFKIYLKILGKNPGFIDHINYVTPIKIKKLLKRNGIISENVAEEKIRNILYEDSTEIKKTHPNIHSLVKLLRKTIIFNKLIYFFVKITKIYPVIIIKGTKK